MKYVHLGNTNLLVSPFCLGAMMFGGKTDRQEGIEIVHQAIDAGINFVDTADVYNEGRSEEIVGEALQGLRDTVVLASKAGMQVGKGRNDAGLSRYHIVRAAEASLKRLRTDRIDLYYVHWPVERLNLEEMARALEDLVAQGKILYPACSNFPAWFFCRTLWVQDKMGCAPLVAGQYPYNLIERGVEVEILPMAKALGLGIVTYRALSAGTLTAKYLDGAPDGSRGVDDERIGRWTECVRRGHRQAANLCPGPGLQRRRRGHRLGGQPSRRHRAPGRPEPPGSVGGQPQGLRVGDDRRGAGRDRWVLSDRGVGGGRGQLSRPGGDRTRSCEHEDWQCCSEHCQSLIAEWRTQ